MRINAGSLYAAFGSKREIFANAMRRYLTRVCDEGLRRLDRAPSGVEGVRRYFDHIAFGISEGHRRHGCLGTNSIVELRAALPEVDDMIINHFDTLELAFAAALRRDKVPDAHQQARFLVCFVQGLNVWSRTAPSRAELDQIIATALTPLVSHRTAA